MDEFQTWLQFDRFHVVLIQRKVLPHTLCYYLLAVPDSEPMLWCISWHNCHSDSAGNCCTSRSLVSSPTTNHFLLPKQSELSDKFLSVVRKRDLNQRQSWSGVDPNRISLSLDCNCRIFVGHTTECYKRSRQTISGHLLLTNSPRYAITIIDSFVGWSQNVTSAWRISFAQQLSLTDLRWTSPQSAQSVSLSIPGRHKLRWS